MPRDPRKPKHGSSAGSRLSRSERSGSGWPGLLLLSTGWVGLVLVRAAPEELHDPPGRTAILSVASLAIVSLAAIGGGAAISIAAALSPTRHVFTSGPAFRIAALLLGVSVINIAWPTPREPFDGILAHGLPPVDLIADLAYLAASVISVVAATTALSKGLNARRRERSWGAPTR